MHFAFIFDYDLTGQHMVDFQIHKHKFCHGLLYVLILLHPKIKIDLEQ